MSGCGQPSDPSFQTVAWSRITTISSVAAPVSAARSDLRASSNSAGASPVTGGAPESVGTLSGILIIGRDSLFIGGGVSVRVSAGSGSLLSSFSCRLLGEFSESGTQAISKKVREMSIRPLQEEKRVVIGFLDNLTIILLLM